MSRPAYRQAGLLLSHEPECNSVHDHIPFWYMATEEH